jgi:predicted methyltransferase
MYFLMSKLTDKCNNLAHEHSMGKKNSVNCPNISGVTKDIFVQ